MLHEELEQLELLGGELELEPIHADAAFRREQAQVLRFQFARLLVTRLMAPEQGAAAGHQFADAEGFDQVVIGPQLEPEHTIGFGVPGADHQHEGPLRQFDQFAAEIKAVDAREHHIENDQLKRLFLQSIPGALAVGRGRDAEAFELQRLADRLTDGVVVFDHQQARAVTA